MESKMAESLLKQQIEVLENELSNVRTEVPSCSGSRGWLEINFQCDFVFSNAHEVDG
jgi:hypothetical protein